MAEADDNAITTPPRLTWSTPTITEVHFVEVVLQGESDIHVDAQRHRDLNLDGPPPLSAPKFLELALAQLKDAPDCPQKVTDAARRLAPEMLEAFLRRQVDAAWDWRSIKNALLNWGYWPRVRSPKS